MKKYIKVSLWVIGGIIGLPIIIISIMFLIHICTSALGTNDNMSYKDVYAKHPDAEMIFYIGQPQATLIKDCVVEYAVVENAKACIKIKEKKSIA